MCIPLACLAAGAEFSPKFHPGIWLSKGTRYSCCDAVNKRCFGCEPISHQVPESQSQFCWLSFLCQVNLMNADVGGPPTLKANQFVL